MKMRYKRGERKKTVKEMKDNQFPDHPEVRKKNTHTHIYYHCTRSVKLKNSP